MKTNTFSFDYCTLNFSELQPELQEVVNAAKDATFTSYAPFSHFSVGAAVLLEDGTIVKGSNQENAAYPSGLCAERVTMFSANANHPDKAPVALAIAARNNGVFTDDPITPCGACRQVLVETEKRFGKPIKVILYGEKRIIVVDCVAHLLPFTFDFLDD